MNSQKHKEKREFFLQKILFLPENIIQKIRTLSENELEEVFPLLEKIYEKEQSLLENIAKKNPDIFIQADRDIFKQHISTLQEKENTDRESELEDLENILSEL